ncbi:MAG: hypothetical protein IT380_30620 [Myxococcales bacterium]|nr:hypothetical protein [Myxococcales bacterium]
MSEYTRYFAVKSSSAIAVRDVLERAQIKSVVDAAEDGFGFWGRYARERGTPYAWVVVTAPADSGFLEDGQFYHHDRFDHVAELFPVVISFFQEEDMRGWSLKIKTAETVTEWSFYDETSGDLSTADRTVFEEVFERAFEVLAPLLRPRKSSGFLNSVGIAYFEMLDQDKAVQGALSSGRSSVLRAELLAPTSPGPSTASGPIEASSGSGSKT